MALVTRKLTAMIHSADPLPIYSKRKAITTLFTCVITVKGGERREVVDALLRSFGASGREGFVWHCVEPFVNRLLSEEGSASSKRAILLASSHFPWDRFANAEHLIRLWATAASTVPYTDDIGQGVVDALLLIAVRDTRRLHIPDGMWSWLNKRPSLPPVSWGRYWGSHASLASVIKKIGNIEILKSYLLLVWSEWDYLGYGGLDEMELSIREKFGGLAMVHHRHDLLRHLDQVLGRLDLGLEHLQKSKPSLGEHSIQQMKGQYGSLKDVLLEMNRGTMRALNREKRQVSYYTLTGVSRPKRMTDLD